MSTEDITNYRRVNDQISTGGQPTEEQLRAAAAEGFKTVINLATINPRYSLDDEAGLVQSLGMAYHHIPVEWEHPQASDFAAFEAVMTPTAGEQDSHPLRGQLPGDGLLFALRHEASGLVRGAGR